MAYKPPRKDAVRSFPGSDSALRRSCGACRPGSGDQDEKSACCVGEVETALAEASVTLGLVPFEVHGWNVVQWTTSSKSLGDGRKGWVFLVVGVTRMPPVWGHVPLRGVVYRLEARYQVCGLPDQSSLSAVPLASSSAVAGRTAATVQVKTRAWPARGWLPSRVASSPLISVTR